MYQPLIKRDNWIILQGLMFLAMIICAGVGVAQYQLANLTQEAEPVQIASESAPSSRSASLQNIANYLPDERVPKFSDAFIIFNSVLYQLSLPDEAEYVKENIAALQQEFEPEYTQLQENAYEAKKYINEELKKVQEYFYALK